ncbi:hypothetical protein AB0N07_25825 [Streptomyces sp. NPDC051172]|uniref:hypothetical protein n=1 Tax=Streptomyces sp. NPDC051172 TaxID=3155796 RepID=UPI003424EEC8
MSTTPLLRDWFAIVASSAPAAEFHGDRVGLEEYLEQREKSALTHHILLGARVNGTELVLGETRRGGASEASFNASAELSADGARFGWLLMSRSPQVRFAG